MARLSKAEVARRIGVTRATLYRHIKDGRIAVEADGCIETTELLKRGYELNVSSETTTGEIKQIDTLVYERLIETLEREQNRLAHELEAAKEREATATHEKAALLELLRSQQRLLDAGQPRHMGFWRWASTWLRGRPASPGDSSGTGD